MNSFHKSDFRCATDKNMSANARSKLSKAVRIRVSVGVKETV